jgi:hypothetical protein
VGAEDNFASDTDRDGTINALDPDSDNDGLYDGTERGVTTPNADTTVVHVCEAACPPVRARRKCMPWIDAPRRCAYGARQMGDKSPKSKDKNKKQDSKAKKAASAAAVAKQTVSPASPKKGK